MLKQQTKVNNLAPPTGTIRLEELSEEELNNWLGYRLVENQEEPPEN